MKYIIDVPSDLYAICKTLRVPVKVGNGDLSWYNTYIKAEPYTEPDRKAIEDEVWEFAWEVLQLDLPVFREIFGYDTDKMDYRDYKYKYDAWRKQKDEIRVGDEIISVEDDVKAVMLDRTDYESIYVMTENGCVERWKDLGGVKTGRHFNEVEELLKKVRGAE